MNAQETGNKTTMSSVANDEAKSKKDVNNVNNNSRNETSSAESEKPVSNEHYKTTPLQFASDIKDEDDTSTIKMESISKGSNVNTKDLAKESETSENENDDSLQRKVDPSNDITSVSDTRSTESNQDSSKQVVLSQVKTQDTKQDRSIKSMGNKSTNAGTSSQEIRTLETSRLTNRHQGNQQHHNYQQQFSHYGNNIHHNSQQQHHHHHSHSQANQQRLQHQNQQHLHHQYNNEILSKTNLYIRGLAPETSDADLYSLCSRFGTIVSTKAILDKSTNKCKGYGFVDFETPSAAEMAVSELQKQGILVHMAKAQDADPTNLYIANLPQTMTESELESILKPFGQVVSTRILVNQNRQPRGVGFARMETKEQCDSIIASLHCKLIEGSKEPLLVKFADGANKKRPHHFQHKPLGSNQSFIGMHTRRHTGNDTNHYHTINSVPGANRNFHTHSGPFTDQGRQSHAVPHHDNGLKHQQIMTSVPGYHPSGGHHSYMMQQHHTQMMAPSSAIDPNLHYVNLANQMQGLQLGNHPVGGYMSPQQWQPVWPGGSNTFTNTTNTNRDSLLR